ncbi:MAG: DUF3575 domain-containing protein [Bacteroides sp.]|nr:DUF3575 domain-containing protein [Bacteroides sp.]
MKFIKVILLFIATVFTTHAYTQNVALKNNLILDGTASVNLGVEFKTGKRTTAEIPFSFNSWDYSEDKKLKHIAVQPEFRWWACSPFTGHFWGIHGHYAFFNAGGVGPFTSLKENRYEGWLAGAGVSYGYNWILAPRWSIEATVGVGYAYISYDKFRCGKCQPPITQGTKNYFGLTKVGLTFVFLLK